MRRFAATGALIVVLSLAAVTGASAATPSPSYQLGGVGLGTTFLGTGIGSTGDRGFFQATMTNDASGALTGTFSLRSNNGSQLAGTWSNGQTAVAAAAPGCGRQQLTVTATLTTAGGSLVLNATVTQFRLLLRGTCTTLASTFQGTLNPAPAPVNDPGPGGEL
jgi:hypothetical protein